MNKIEIIRINLPSQNLEYWKDQQYGENSNKIDKRKKERKHKVSIS